MHPEWQAAHDLKKCQARNGFQAGFSWFSENPSGAISESMQWEFTPLQAGHEGQPSSNDGPAFYGMIHELGKNLSLSHVFWWWVLLGFYYPTMIVCFYIITKNYTYICIYIYIYVDNRIYNWDVIIGIIMPNNEEINNLWTPQQVIWISPWWKATAHIKARSPK